MLRTFITEPSDSSVIEKVLRYQVSHPMPEPRTFAERYGPTRIIHRLKWVTVMVSREDAKVVFRQAFSRPPRLLFGNPVAFIFSAYYAYIYGEAFSEID
jgi:DHA1 family multidrug resistance protein-like MFS transporter